MKLESKIIKRLKICAGITFSISKPNHFIYSCNFECFL